MPQRSVHRQEAAARGSVLIDLVKLLAAMLLVVGALVACEGGGPKAGQPSAQPPTMHGISDPLARIRPRQEVIKELVPDQPLVIKQADATIADAGEARAAIDSARAEMQGELDAVEAAAAAARTKLESELAKVKEELRLERDTSNKRYRQWVNLIRIGCLLGIAGGIILAVILKRPALVVISLASVVTQAAIAIDGFTWKYGMEIAAGALVVLLTVGLWCLFTRNRATDQLIRSGKVMLERIPGGAQALAGELNAIQSRTTRGFVDRAGGKR